MKLILNFFRKDLWRKLSALVLACLLYWNLSDREKTTKYVTVPVEVDAAAGLFVPEDFKLEVRTAVKGTERSLRDLKIKGTIKVDKTDRRNGKFRIRLDDRNFERRKDVEVTKVEPELVELPIQMYIQRDVKIIPKTGGKVQGGFELKSIECNPGSIRISGPENEVNAIEYIETETLNLDFDRNFTQKLKLIRPQLKNVVCSATETIVKVEIAPMLNANKVFNNIPVRYLLPQSTLSVQKPFSIVPSLSKVSLNIIAPQAVLEDIEPEKLYVVADLSAESFTGQAAKLDVRLYCPAALKSFVNGRIQNIEIHPSAVTVTVRPDKDKVK
ncbi:MAG: YbbR-like domain-containing protein [Lentisphaeria bacterium]|nr:YbbR-like domain-containing protein [Lentisphaeria bacterium]